ncbi:MAG: arginase family protein [Nanoarchaeota archaeon]
MQIIKVPGINGLGKTKGCEKAGNEILTTLKEIYSNEQEKPIDVKLLDLEEIHLDNGNLELTNKLIYENALEAYDKNRVIFLGGDHSISFSIVKAFLKHSRVIGKEPCLIVFDSHPDCMKPVKGFPTHEEWLRGLIEEGFPSENVLLVGVRNSYVDELKFISENKIKIIKVNQILENLEETSEVIMEFANKKELYLSIDVDVVDPAFAPGTGYKEPGGLTSRQLIYIIQRMNKMKNLKAIDIVEINPSLDKDNLTVKLGAKILAELL